MFLHTSEIFDKYKKMTFSFESLENPQKIRHLEPKCQITENKKNMAFDNTRLIKEGEHVPLKCRFRV